MVLRSELTFFNILKFICEKNSLNINKNKFSNSLESINFNKLSKMENISHFPESVRSNQKFFRKGIVDEWQDILPKSIATEIEKKYEDIITNTEGEIIKIEKWGLLSFSKKIKAYNKGFYIHYKFKGESKTLDEIKKNSVIDNSLLRHLTVKYKILDTETEYFKEKVINEEKVINLIRMKEFDYIISYGCSIIPSTFINKFKNKILNIHLGLSPYYRGSGTNFWPFINDELQYLGSTILHVDAGIDTGDIICHVRPTIEINDNVHTIGCKIIRDSVDSMIKIMDLVASGQTLNRIKQWNVDEKYYKTKDFNETVLQKYKTLLNNGNIKNYLAENNKDVKLVNL
jgi:ribosomal protein S6